MLLVFLTLLWNLYVALFSANLRDVYAFDGEIDNCSRKCFASMRGASGIGELRYCIQKIRELHNFCICMVYMAVNK